jgi:ethanolamine utilization protein EutL
MGILAGATPAAVRSGMAAALSCLERVGFDEINKVPYLAHTVSRCGSFLSKEAGIPEGSALAYLIAPPLEGMYAMDFALKAADVKLCKLYAPPSETNFGGGLLTGSQSACQAACAAFAQAVTEVADRPREGE